AQPLLSSKQQEFLTIARIVRAMEAREKLIEEGFRNLADMDVSMNGGGRYRRVYGARWQPESSETIRQTSLQA
ncbi:MAG: hypothetical protein ACRDKS_12930, partial [Actinomycetota bacterium]